jgi:MFS family permease
MGYEAMIPSFARRVLATDVRGYSLLLACSGIGATCGALAVASLGGLRRRELLVLGGLVLFAGALALSAIVPSWVSRVLPGPARLVAASACLFGAGLGAVVFYSSTQTLIQSAVPDHLRGRIMGIWMIVYSGSVSLGAFGTGRVAQSRGVLFAIGLSACLCLAIALAAFASGWLVQPTDPAEHGDEPNPGVGTEEEARHD